MARGPSKEEIEGASVTYRDHQQLARNLAEVIEQTFEIERPRERRIDLIAHHVLRAIRIGFRSKHLTNGGNDDEAEIA
jgi:hypothetical protein